MALRRLRRSSISDGTTSSVLKLCDHVNELFILIIKKRMRWAFYGMSCAVEIMNFFVSTQAVVLAGDGIRIIWREWDNLVVVVQWRC